MKIFFLIMVLILAGCSTVGNVLPVSDDIYTVTTSGHYKSWPDLKASCIQRANEFCTEQHKNMVVIGWEEYGVRGWSPQDAELTFKCSAEQPAD